MVTIVIDFSNSHSVTIVVIFRLSTSGSGCHQLWLAGIRVYFVGFEDSDRSLHVCVCVFLFFLSSLAENP